MYLINNIFHSSMFSRTSTIYQTGIFASGHILIHEALANLDNQNKPSFHGYCNFNPRGSREPRHGPYRNAWTIDGNLVADFVTTGSMLADRIRGGTLELGGTGLGRDGSIIVKDAAGNLIGSWDKTGLSILKGILQGVSAVFGGVNNQDGAIEVRNASGRLIGRWDNSGLYIIKGNITVGPFEATEDGVILGDWEVSADGTNVFRSIDGSITIQNEQGGPLGSYAAMRIGNTAVSDHHVAAISANFGGINGDCELSNNTETGVSSWWAGYTLFDALDDLYKRIKDIESNI